MLFVSSVDSELQKITKLEWCQILYCLVIAKRKMYILSNLITLKEH